MKIWVVGASGMIGSTVFRVLSERGDLEVWGTVRQADVRRFFTEVQGARLLDGVDVEHQDALVRSLDKLRPSVVVNCAGLTKHKAGAEDPLVSIPINTLMPHRLAGLCKLMGVRLIHVSTDCVFSGAKGLYTESDLPDARDVYGQSKALGEVHDAHALTLRTSTIGHELNSSYGLLDWFLSQKERCQGFTRAIFSGLPTVVFAQVVRDVVIPRPELRGLYHVAASPIDKYRLLKLIAKAYGKDIVIESNDQLKIDRSLNPARFNKTTGYTAPDWPELIATMRTHQY